MNDNDTRRRNKNSNCKTIRWQSHAGKCVLRSGSDFAGGACGTLQVFNTEFLTQQADSGILRTESITAHRGTITDRNGEPLAISTPVDSVWANPKELALAEDKIPALARALGLDEQTLIRQITFSMNKDFVYLRRHLSPDKAAEVMSLKLPGVNIQREYRRYYPAGEVVGHLVGFTNIDDKGLEGLELAYNYWLAGESGAKRVLKDRLGRSVENVESIRPPHHGKESTHQYRSANPVRSVSCTQGGD